MSCTTLRFACLCIVILSRTSVLLGGEIDTSKKVKVFILAGQSNMVGQAKISLFDHQIKAPETKELFAHLHKDGKYIVRDDVWISYQDKHGGLTVGYGGRDRCGPELEFGHVVGNKLNEQVLLIKTAWGGKSIGVDFRPPSSGMPPEEKLKEILEKTNANNRKRKRPEVALSDIKAKYGKYYRDMMKEINTCLAELPQCFPSYKGQGYEIVGFVWFQGWNDMCNKELAPEYGTHMANFIRDVRKDLKKPNLPFVIGVMGQNGSKPATGSMLQVQNAQKATAELPEFKATVKAVPTDIHVDKRAEALCPNWRKDIDAWNKVGSDHGYHYYGSAIWYTRIGRALAEATLQLMKK